MAHDDYTQFLKPIRSAVLHVVFLSLAALIVTVCVYLDAIWIGDGVPENSFTEWTQELLLLAVVVLFFHSALRAPDSRPFLVLVAGFFACLLIREWDAAIDRVHPGFWKWSAMAVAAVCIAYALRPRHRHTLLPTAARFCVARAMPFLSLGLVVLLVLSRTFGSGQLIWQELLGDGYTIDFKSTIQEGLELFGYLLIFYGAVVWTFEERTHTRRARSG